MGSASNSSGSRPGYTRAGGDWLGQGELPLGLDQAGMDQLGGYFGDVKAQQMFPIEQLFGGLQPLSGAANQGGAMLRDLASGATNQAYKNTMDLGTMATQSLGQLPPGMAELRNQNNYFTNLAPQMFGAAQTWADKGINPALTAGQQSLANVMNPTMYNPLFQNASANLTNQIDSSMAARGLATSGANTEALRQGNQDLADSFAQRQFQEQMQAQGQLGNMGMAAAQVPGNVFNQFMSGLGQGNQNALAGLQGQGMNLANLGAAGQQQLLPLQALGLGGGVFNQGLNMPLSMASGLYDLSRNPINAFANFINSVPNVSKSNTSGFFASLFQ